MLTIRGVIVNSVIVIHVRVSLVVSGNFRSSAGASVSTVATRRPPTAFETDMPWPGDLWVHPVHPQFTLSRSARTRITSTR